MISGEQYRAISDIASFLSQSPTELTTPQLKAETEVQKERSAFFHLLAEGLTFGLYDPHFTREEMERNRLLFAKIPLKEAILDKIPVVKHIADAILPYDVSLATLIQWMTLGVPLRIAGRLGGKIIKKLHLDNPLMRVSLPVARRFSKIFKGLPQEEVVFIPERIGKRIELIPETVYKWQERIYNSVAIGIGIGVGEGIKGLYEASKGKRDLGEALINFSVAPAVNSLFFPLIDVGFEGVLRKTFFNPGRMLKRSERELLREDIKSSNKISPAGEQLANNIEKRTEENLVEKITEVFEKHGLSEALRRVASAELLSKLEKSGITRITFSHFENVDQIANEALRTAVNLALQNPDFIKTIKNPYSRQLIEGFVNQFKLLQRQEIAKSGMTLGKLFDELRVEKEIKSLLPEDLKNKAFKQMTLEEKQRAMEIINQNASYLGMTVTRPEVLEKLDAFIGQFYDLVKRKPQSEVKLLIKEYLDKLNPEQRKKFWQEMIPDLSGATLRFSNDSLSFLYHLTGKKPEKLLEKDREKLIEMLAEGQLLPAYLNQLAKQTKVIFDVDDRGELLIDILSNISKEGNAKKHLSVLEEGFRNATYSQIANFERKKSIMLEDPLVDALQKITSGRREIPEGASKEKIIDQIQKRIVERQFEPAKWIIEERISVLGKDYDIWTLAADAYKISGKHVNEVIDALEEHYTKGKFDEKVFDIAFSVFKKYPIAKEIEKSSKSPTEKMVKLLEYLKNEKDKFEFTQKDNVVFSQENTAYETLNKINTTQENVRTHIHQKAKEKFFSQEAFEKIPNVLLDIYKEAENKNHFTEKLSRIDMDKILDHFVFGGKYGLKELPKKGDKVVMLRPEISNKPIEFYVETIRKKTFLGESEIVVKPLKEEDRKITVGMALKPEQFSFYSLLAEAGEAMSIEDALFKVISKYSLKNPKVAKSKGVELKKISFKEALELVGYEPDPVDDILKGKIKMKIPDDTWEDWKMVFGDDLKRFGTKNPRYEPADSLATEYGFSSEEEFKNYLADRLNLLKRAREEAKKIRDHYEFNEKTEALSKEEDILEWIQF